MIPAFRNISLPFSVACLLLFLSAAPGCGNRCVRTEGNGAPTDNTMGTERAGVTVTKEVPHSNETISDIRNREGTNPLPGRGDTAIHSHKIPRNGSDNGASIPPADGQPVKRSPSSSPSGACDNE